MTWKVIAVVVLSGASSGWVMSRLVRAYIDVRLEQCGCRDLGGLAV